MLNETTKGKGRAGGFVHPRQLPIVSNLIAPCREVEQVGRFENLTDEKAVKIVHEIAEYLQDENVSVEDALRLLECLTSAMRLVMSIEAVKLAEPPEA